MSYMSRLWMATSVAVVNTHTDQGNKLKSGVKSINHVNNRFFSAHCRPVDAADLRPCSAVLNSELGGSLDKRKQGDESLRQVMYFNCWGQG